MGPVKKSDSQLHIRYSYCFLEHVLFSLTAVALMQFVAGRVVQRKFKRKEVRIKFS